MESLRYRLPVRRSTRLAVGLAWLSTVASCVFYVAVGRGVVADTGDGSWLWAAVIAGLVAATVAALIPLVDDRAQRTVERTVRTLVIDRILAADNAFRRAALPTPGRLVSTGTDGATKIAALRGGFVAAVIAAATAPVIVLVAIGIVAEAINGRLEALRRNALGFRNLIHYRYRSLLHSGQLTTALDAL